MRSFVTAAILLGICFGSRAQATPVKITTFNAEFYGNNANQGTDTRNRTMQEFFRLADVDPDIFAFEEVVDVPALESGLLNRRYSCHSYDHASGNHQHVVICHKPNFVFRVANDDNNYAWEDVAQSTLRPAVHGILAQRNGRDLAHVVALHLKAMPDQGARRLEQTRLVANNLARRGDDLPIVLLGDLNTYGDEISAMERIYRDRGVRLTAVELLSEFTYRTNRYQSTFDWLLVSGDVEVLSSARVEGPCNDDWVSGSAFDDLAYYNDRVSDHCPVNVVLDL